MNILKIAFKNLNRQKRRSILLALAITFAFFVVIFMDGMTAGALKSMSGEVAKIVGGHVFIIGAKKPSDKTAEDSAQLYMDKKDIDYIEKTIQDLNIDPLYIIKRSRTSGKLIFEGLEFPSQIDGCNFAEEKLLHDSILFKEGNWDAMKKENAILLSESVADSLKVNLHDIILLETKTSNGQLTVVELQVEGIAVNRSAFAGLTNYINFDYSHKILGLTDDAVEVYAVFLKNPDTQEFVASHIEKKLSENFAVTSRDLARKVNPSQPASNIFTQLEEGKWEGTKYGVASFYDFAPQVVTLMNTLTSISFGILIVLLVITMIGVSNTFKIIVHERKGEIGTMRSCGVMKKHVKRLFLSEASFLSILGASAGFILAIIVMQIIGLIYIPVESPFSVFTKNGYFTWTLSAISVIAKFLIMLILTLITVRGSASKAANMVPAEALRTGK